MPVTLDKAYQKQILTTFVRAVLNDSSEFVANKIAPFLQVNKDSGQIYDYGRQGLRVVKSSRSVGGRYKKIDFNVDLVDRWFLEDNGLFDYVYSEEVENAESPIMAEQAKAKLISQIMLLNYEDAVASLITTTNIPQNVTLSGTSQWNDYVNSNPVVAIDNGKEAMRISGGKRPNAIFMSRPVFDKLKRHPKIIELFKGGAAASIITDQLLEEVVLKDILGFKYVAIGEAQYLDVNLNTGMNNWSLTDIWGKKCLLYYTEENPEIYSTTFAKTFAKREGVQAGSFTVSEEDRKVNKIYSGVLVEDKRDIQIVDNKVAYLFENAVA